MRNLQAEKKIDKYLSGHFFLDPSKYDVTVIGDQAEITGMFINRTTQQPLSELRIKEVQRFFKRGMVEGVRNYYYHLHPHVYV